MEDRPISPLTAENKCATVDWKQQCAALIPGFNAGATIAEVVRGVRAQLPTVFVVDDGSTDDTAERAAAAGAEVVRHATNRGKGAALRVGFQHLRDRGFAWALMLDGDGQHAAEDIPAFFQRAEETGAALVVGNRMGGADGMPWLRRRVNGLMSRQLSRLTGVALADSQCGFRLVNLVALAPLQLSADRFEIESEMLVALLGARQRVEFVPVQVIYKTSASEIHPVVDTWRWVRWRWAQRRRKF